MLLYNASGTTQAQQISQATQQQANSSSGSSPGGGGAPQQPLRVTDTEANSAVDQLLNQQNWEAWPPCRACCRKATPSSGSA